jgi:alkylhydroperoxidase/carboxymuconolactone decarboxylase family protein YurZ
VFATVVSANTGINAQVKHAPGGTVQVTQPNIDKRRLSPDDVRKVAPALEAYTQERLYGEVWKRPGLAARDRSLVTIAALIARDQAPALTYYFNQAIENGVKPREISEIITHLAFYAGWANAFATVGPARDVFAARGIGADQIPTASVQRLPLNDPAEAERAKRVDEQFGTTAPGVVQYTTDVLFRDLWLRPDLPTWIWSVVVEGGLNVRAYNGRPSRWYQAAVRQQAGRIRAAGLTRDVLFEPIDGPINDRIDIAYRAKYRGSPYVPPMIDTGAREATVRVRPRRPHASA